MTELNPLSDQSGTPEDVATLYSWANLHGAKYRDFSAARAQTREKTRLRAEQALEEQKQQAEQGQQADQEQQAEQKHQAEEALNLQQAAQAAEARSAVEAAQAQAEAAAQAELAHQQELTAQLAAQKAAQQAAEQEARTEAERAAQQAAEAAALRAAQLAAELAEQQAAQQARERAAQVAAEQAAHFEAERVASQAAQHAAQQIAQQRAWQQPPAPPAYTAPAPPPAAPYFQPQPSNFGYPAFTQPQAYRAPLAPPLATSPVFDPRPAQPSHPAPAREGNKTPRNPWAVPEQRDYAGRPAWLNNDVETPATSDPQPSLPSAPDDTLQGSRDRLASRWFALRGVFDGNYPPAEAVPAPTVSRAPSVAVFSLAGGVGKTSLVATLGRALSERGERVLLVDTAAFGLLPFFFGATDQRPGVLRTFAPPGASNDAPVQMVTIDPEGLNAEVPGQESLSGEIFKFARGAGRIIVDLATASGATTRRILRMAPLVLVPVVPDMNSVVSVSSIDAFFEHNSNPNGKPAMPYYVINQFDASMPLHLDVREVLREQLGERLLPFALRRTPAMSEALAEGMTVMDYAPNSPLAEDFSTLAGWVKSLSAPATTSYRGVRWSER